MEYNRILMLVLSIFHVTPVKLKPIVGGLVVRTAGDSPKYPYMVSLQDRHRHSAYNVNANGSVSVHSTYGHFCGGSVITSEWILTAAHCMWKKDIRNVVAVVGHENISNANKTEKYEIASVEYLHFQPTSYRNDIALLRLQRPYRPPIGSFGEFNAFAKLPKYGMKASRKKPCTIIGYGAQYHAGAVQEDLNEANVYVITNKQCRSILGRIWAPKNGENTICAQGDNQDSCQGDSGGPLICNYNGQDYVYGIVSHGLTCGIRGMPSIYTVTVPYVEWIQKFVNTT